MVYISNIVYIERHTYKLVGTNQELLHKYNNSSGFYQNINED